MLGNLPTLHSNPRQQFKTWRKQHGDLFSLYFGSTLVVVVSGYDRIKELLVGKASTSFLDRPVMYANEVIGMENTGLAFSNGRVWQETRSASMSILKELGLGKNMLAEKIQEDIEFLMERISSFDGDALDLWDLVNTSVANVICSILIGKRFNYEDDRFKDVVKKVNQLASCAKEVAAINYLPLLAYLPGDVLKTHRLREAVQGLSDFAEFCCKDGWREDVSEESDEKENFISLFKRKQQEECVKGEGAVLDDQNLRKTVMDLLGAGAESISTTIAWFVLYLLHNPEVQVKVHEELDSKIGQGRLPCMADKLKLPYLEAVIKETQRLASINPFSIMRATNQDACIGGYFIPEGTSVIPSMDSVLHDPEIWGPDADSFRPERFLDADGALRRIEEFIPFTMGRRSCPGMGLAQMELFLFLSSLLQRFDLETPPGDDLPTLEEELGLLAAPKRYEVCCVDRHKKIG